MGAPANGRIGEQDERTAFSLPVDSRPLDDIVQPSPIEATLHCIFCRDGRAVRECRDSDLLVQAVRQIMITNYAIIKNLQSHILRREEPNTVLLHPSEGFCRSPEVVEAAISKG